MRPCEKGNPCQECNFDCLDPNWEGHEMSKTTYCFEVAFENDSQIPPIGPGMTIFGAPVTGVRFAPLDIDDERIDSIETRLAAANKKAEAYCAIVDYIYSKAVLNIDGRILTPIMPDELVNLIDGARRVINIKKTEVPR